MTDADRYRLIGGPYATTDVRAGGSVYDRLRCQRVVVRSWRETAFGSWPCVGRSGSSLVVTDDLLAAIETESSIAVAHHWRVCAHTAARWRKKAGVTDPQAVPGTRRLYHDYTPEKVGSPAASDLARIARIATDAPVRSGRRRKGRPLPRADGWTPDEDAVCRRHTLAECCRLLPRRTRTAISIRRSRLKAADADDPA